MLLALLCGFQYNDAPRHPIVYLLQCSASLFPASVRGVSLDWSLRFWINEALIFLPLAVIANALPDYVSLLKTRYLIGATKVSSSSKLKAFGKDLIATALLSIPSAALLRLLFSLGHSYMQTVASLLFLVEHQKEIHILFPEYLVHDFLAEAQSLITTKWGLIFFYPAFFTTMWTMLYAGSGFLLKAACRFDIGFEWFNRHFDIEKKPLQSIGLVAGALVAMVYWTAAIVSRVVG